jgi:hypothetical protein
MSAVDAPPGIAFAGRASGEFTARPRSRRLARRVFVFTLFVGAITISRALRDGPMRSSSEYFMIIPLVCVSIAAVGYAVRRARLRFDGGGVRWGWEVGGFTMSRDRMTGVEAFENAVAFVPKRGSTWYVSARDWDRFDQVPAAMRKANIDFTPHAKKAPIAATLQSYGIALDIMLVIDAVAAGAMALFSFGA